uniref:Uncharacterized protein n=1 Tax=Arcella intermedia TaxID=1963864 RepID=A0A6B2L3Q4_9EUKA
MIYAEAGAAVISVLTEPKWFKTTLEDMKAVRQAVNHLPNRPAILRKEFIVDDYQIYEARVHGADTVLLIVAALTDEELTHFMIVSRSLKMEPLVEVATAEEMNRAISLGAKVIGINNRNLHTFTVDPSTTTSLLPKSLDSSITFCALSGITCAADVELYRAAGARGMLVGEALMKSPSPGNKILELTGKYFPLVKICGIMEKELAISTLQSGADFLGLVFAESRRKVDTPKAKALVQTIHAWKKERFLQEDGNFRDFYRRALGELKEEEKVGEKWWKVNESITREGVRKFGPLVVGVFANQDEETVLRIANEVSLDIVQLSGKEWWEVGARLGLLCGRCVHVQDGQKAEDIVRGFVGGGFATVLLDTSSVAALGGTGQAFDWNIASQISHQAPIALAGGLNPQNIKHARQLVRPFIVDVSSGVETNAAKDPQKITLFVKNAKFE